jgi:hypothetical protein
MKPFYRDAEIRHLVHQRREEITVGIGAEQRVTEHAGRQRRRPDTFLVGPRLRRLDEVEPLEFHSAHRHHAQRFGSLQHALQ